LDVAKVFPNRCNPVILSCPLRYIQRGLAHIETVEELACRNGSRPSDIDGFYARILENATFIQCAERCEPEGMIRVDKLLHSAKAPPSIKVRLGESVTLVKPSQIKNVLLVDYQYYTL